jgi:hypothetical protein
MAPTPQMEKLLAEAPPLTDRQRDLIAACFGGVELEADEATEGEDGAPDEGPAIPSSSARRV